MTASLTNFYKAPHEGARHLWIAGSFIMIKNRINHGLTRHPLYSIWNNIKYRCYNTNAWNYEKYGGRGIIMCDEWLRNPLLFFKYVSNLENYDKPGFSIDRIDNDGNYEPGNIQWSTRHTQQTNQQIYSNNKSGYTGISFSKQHKKWRSQITINNKRIYLGRYTTPKEAAIVRDRSIIKNELHE